MKRRLTVILTLLVLIPMILLAGLSLRIGGAEAQRARRRFDEILELRAADADAELVRRMRDREREALAALQIEDTSAEALRQRMRESRLIAQIFVVDADGALAYPPADGTARERDFLARTRDLFAGGAIARRPDPEARDAGFGWRSWYWGDGVHWLLWRRQASGAVIGAELDRAALVADLVAGLPSTEAAGGPAESRFSLSEAGRTLYQWGGYSPPPGERPRLRRALTEPLEAWTVQAYAPDLPAAPGALVAPIASIAAVVVALAGLALYFHRESSRELRDAGERMSFVSRVSHELKTPLTNIRLYAELLERRLPASDARAREQLSVVVSESRRLGRLIANVLTFTRRGTGSRELAPRPGVVDETIAAVLAHFQPALEAAGFVVDFERGAGDTVLMDADAVEQIVGNLLSNAEKYAASGRYLGVRSSRRGELTEVEVSDRGPGIPREARERVFQPFVRLSNRLTDGVAGTGIGLTIARELAQQHGGDLVAAAAARGARFVLSLRTPMVGDPAPSTSGEDQR